MADPQPKPTRRSEPTRALGEADDVRLYLEAAAREPLLTKEEEVELAMAIEHGEEAEAKLEGGRLKAETSIRKAKELVRKGREARQRFIRANLRLVFAIARKYQGQGLPFLDQAQEQSPLDAVEDAMLRHEIGQAVMNVLDARERRVIALRYGLGNGHAMSLRDVGKVMGLSGERVRLIEREALRKLRHSEIINAAGWI